MLNLHRFRPSRAGAVPLRYNRDTDPRSAGSSISSLSSSGRRRRQRISHPRSRRPDIHLHVVLPLIFTSLPRDRIYIRRIIMAASYGEPMKIFRGRALTSRDDREERGAKRRGNEYEINSIPRKVRACVRTAVTTSCICTLKGPFASLLSFPLRRFLAPSPLIFRLFSPEQLSYIPSRDYFRRGTWKQ